MHSETFRGPTPCTLRAVRCSRAEKTFARALLCGTSTIRLNADDIGIAGEEYVCPWYRGFFMRLFDARIVGSMYIRTVSLFQGCLTETISVQLWQCMAAHSAEPTRLDRTHTKALRQSAQLLRGGCALQKVKIPPCPSRAGSKR